MVDLPSDIISLVASEKLLGDQPAWDDTSDPRYFVFTHALTVGTVATGGFQLRAKLSKRWVDRDALLQLEYAPAGKRSTTALWRLDWRPFHTHGNKGLPPDVAYESYDGSHQHTFADNFMSEAMRMRGSNLPAARLLPKEPNTLSEFLELGGNMFNINDIGRIILPITGPDIFWQDDDRV